MNEYPSSILTSFSDAPSKPSSASSIADVLVVYSNSRKPEIGPMSPYAEVGGYLRAEDNRGTKVYLAFHVDKEAGDSVLS